LLLIPPGLIPSSNVSKAIKSPAFADRFVVTA
jgi:hypothetical protein